MAPKRIIYLDFDGVLNTDGHLNTLAQQGMTREMLKEQPERALLPELVQKFNFFADKGVDFILHTGWCRMFLYAKCLEVLRHHGFKGDILGETPKKFSSTKCMEIRSSLRDEKPDFYAIVDDDVWIDPPGYFKGHLVFTDPDLGVTDENIASLAKILSL